MSVLASDRKVSTAEFINTAYNLTIAVGQSYDRFSASTKKFVFSNIKDSLNALMNTVSEINTIYTPSASLQGLYYKEQLVYHAIGAVKNMDSWFSIGYDISITNNGIEGAKKTLPSSGEALKICDMMTKEVKLLEGVLRQVRTAIKKKVGEEYNEVEDGVCYTPLLRKIIENQYTILGMKENLVYDVSTNNYTLLN